MKHLLMKKQTNHKKIGLFIFDGKGTIEFVVAEFDEDISVGDKIQNWHNEAHYWNLEIALNDFYKH